MNSLYHYCSPAAFMSMIVERRVWLSALSLANDSMEGRIMAKAFAKFFVRDSLDPESVAPIQSALENLPELFEGFAFCLSEEGDLLSQWRGYAVDGRGFSLGFSSEYLRRLANHLDPNTQRLYLTKVLYRQAEQEAALLSTYEAFKEEVTSGRLKTPRRPTLLGGLGIPDADEKYQEALKEYNSRLFSIYLKMAMSIENLYSLKNEAFIEEKEWRLLSHLIKSSPEHCQFRVSDNRIVPYRELQLPDLGIPSISKVVIGPKSSTPEYVVRRLLAQYGYANVEVVRSTASYR